MKYSFGSRSIQLAACSCYNKNNRTRSHQSENGSHHDSLYVLSVFFCSISIYRLIYHIYEIYHNDVLPA